MSGRIGDLSPEQQKKLEEFRHNLSDVLRPEHDDAYLLRWLRARKFNLVAAENMLRKSLEWRKSIGADTILTDYKPPEIMLKYAPGNMIGHDREGCPLWIIPYAQMDMRGMLTTVKKSDITKHFVRLMEWNEEEIRRQSKRLGKNLELHTIIHDLEDLPWRQASYKPTIDTTIEYFKIFEANYPERLKTAFIINAPKFFSAVFDILKLFLSEETQQKIKIYAKGSTEWKEELYKLVDPSELPAHWGGTKVDENGDPKCPSLVRLGGMVPSSYYPNLEELRADNKWKRTTVARRDTFIVEVPVEEASALLRWEFLTEDHDIGFGLFLRRGKKEISGYENERSSKGFNEVTLLPVERMNSHLVVEDGSYVCEVPGTYILKFDNSFSWWFSKKLMYFVEVVKYDPESTKNKIHTRHVS